MVIPTLIRLALEWKFGKDTIEFRDAQQKLYYSNQRKNLKSHEAMEISQILKAYVAQIPKNDLVESENFLQSITI